MSQQNTFKLGKYEIHEELGRGGFGVVYKAYDTLLGRWTAIKVLHSQLTVDPGFIGRFEQEARLAARLEHPNLVSVYEMGQEEGRFYIALGLMSGGSLKDRLKYGPLPEGTVRNVLPGILNGLSFIHKNNIIHRDLKPGNILFDSNDRAKISDLGFAKALQSDSSMSLSMSGGMIGTPAYMAPEVWRGNLASVRSDLYSLGCILYEMLTGEVLFEGETPAMTMTKHLIEGPRFRRDFAEPWKSLLLKSLSMNPINRYPSADAMLYEIDHPRPQTIIQSPVIQKPAATNQPPWKVVKPIQPTHVAAVPKYTNTSPDGWRSYPAQKPYRPPTPTPRVVNTVNKPVVIQPTVKQKPKKKSPVPLVGSLLLLLGVLVIALLINRNKTSDIPLTDNPIPDIPIINDSGKVRIADQMPMVYVPAKKFNMGSEFGDTDETPVHSVQLNAYWIDKYEVSNSQYAKCVSAGACIRPRLKKSFTRTNYYGNAEYDDYPVIYVTWEQAKTYCEWVGGKLPTEAQWEQAAAGTISRIYPWGDENPNNRLANYNNNFGDTSKVGSYPQGASSYGAMDMAGNVWEWVADYYAPYMEEMAKNPTGPRSGTYRILRGGSWYASSRNLRTANRYINYPTNTSSNIGFRCILSQP
jgi:serine/threonine-protein kinase